jgi:hypothetical protein
MNAFRNSLKTEARGVVPTAQQPVAADGDAALHARDKCVISLRARGAQHRAARRG